MMEDRYNDEQSFQMLYNQKFYLMQKTTTLKDFQMMAKLGEGAFAEVFKVRRHEDHQLYAMKKIKLNRLKPKERQNALNQVRILASYNGQFIIGFKEAFFDEPSSMLCIVMEFAAGGDILKVVNNSNKKKLRIPQKEIWKALVHITQGLKSLHDLKVLHRDLKCANIFITGDGVYKLGDLNVSKVLKQDMACTQTGTPYYASPQVWKDKPYGVKSDMWSLGCVLYEMAAGRPPFTAMDLPGLYKKIIAGVFSRIPAQYSNDLANVIASLLKLNPDSRPNTQTLLSNPIVHSHYEGSLQFQQKSHEEEFDCLLHTLKINHRNLSSIQNVLPKANYDGGMINRSRVASVQKEGKKSPRKNSIEKETKEIKEIKEIKKNIEEELKERKINEKELKKSAEEQKKKSPSKPQVIKTEPSHRKLSQIENPSQKEQLKKEEERQKKVVDNYLEVKKRYQQKERERQLQRLKEQKELLIKKRQRVLSACGMRNPSPKLIKQIQSPQPSDKKLQLPVPSSARIPKKQIQNNPIKLPPKPSANYKMPPRPLQSPLPLYKQAPSNKDINISQRDDTSSRQKSREKLRRAGQRILNDGIVKEQQPERRVQRCSSVNKVIYPSWWID